MRQIIAMGGGGFSMEPDNPLLDQYILNQSPEIKPKICFLPTASRDAEGYIEKFYQSFKTLSCIPFHLTMEDLKKNETKEILLEQDILYVGGGDTGWMLDFWREYGVDKWLADAWEEGIILAGLSAGAICWYEESLGEMQNHGYETLRGLGFLKGCYFPHFDTELEDREAFLKLVKNGQFPIGDVADDGVAFHYIDTKLHKIISSRLNAKGYQLSGSHMKEMSVNYLGGFSNEKNNLPGKAL